MRGTKISIRTGLCCLLGRLQENLAHEAAGHQKLMCISAVDELRAQPQHLPQFPLAVWVYGLYEKL